jgi:hypothetical protein
MSSSAAPAVPAAAWTRCRLCRGRLNAEAGDDLVRGTCKSCGQRPEAAKLPIGANVRPAVAPAPPAKPTARAFTEAERSLIRAMHGYLPAAELLHILNGRLVADLGPGTPLYTLEQLHRAIGDVGGAAARADDWTSLRRLLVDARKSGVLEAITPAVAEAFAVVFQLSTAQVTHLKDVLEHARGGR